MDNTIHTKTNYTCFEKAQEMAMNTINSIYEHNQDSCLSDIELKKIKMAVEILEMVKE